MYKIQFSVVHFLSSAHKFRILFIIIGSLLIVLSVLSLTDGAICSACDRSSYYRKKCRPGWEWKAETSKGMFMQKQVVFFPVFLGFLHTAVDWETVFGKSSKTHSIESLYYRGTERWLQLQRHHLRPSQQDLFWVHQQRFMKLLQNWSPPAQHLDCPIHKQFFNTAQPVLKLLTSSNL